MLALFEFSKPIAAVNPAVGIGTRRCDLVYVSGVSSENALHPA